MHTVIVVDAHAQPLRVSCDYCRSEHNYRGGPRSGAAITQSSAAAPVANADSNELPRRTPIAGAADPSPPAVKQDHNIAMSNIPVDGLEAMIRRVIRDETGLTPVTPAEKWRGGQLVLRPGKPGVQEKAIPIDSFFNKVVMLRNRLRTLEQQINASELPDDQKLKLQSYITGCYGSLTTFNVLFANDDDRFVGSGE